MDSDKDSQHIEFEKKVDGARQGQSRRQFSRSAAVGGAVLLTLGNRAAWGGGGHHQQGGDKSLCISKATWNSLQFSSRAPTDEQLEEARKFQEYAEQTHQFPEESRDGKSVCVRKKRDRDRDGVSYGDWRGDDDADRRQEFLDWGFGGGGRD